MRKRAQKTAETFGILEKVEKLERDLLKINGVTEVDFDLDSLHDGLKQVIFLTRYDIPVNSENYFGLRQQLIVDVLEAAKNNGLRRTGDRIEDYGEHFYFVTAMDMEVWSK